MLPRWLKLAGAGFAVLILAAMAFAIFEPIQVLPRVRLAPGYALSTGDGAVITSETARGSVTLYSFAPTECGDRCDPMFETMREVQARIGSEVDLGQTDFRLVTIALDEIDDPAGLAAAAQASGADGVRWQWIGGDEKQIRNVVGAGFERYYEQEADGTIAFDPGFVLVDGNGVIRGEYRYQTLSDDADKFVRHTEILAEEIRYAEGPAAVAYEAAHLFLCYP
ncbi:MAG: SCO family protein [Acidimicrobiales bacterium]